MRLDGVEAEERRRLEAEIRAHQRVLAVTRRALAAVRGEPEPSPEELRAVRPDRRYPTRSS